MANKKYFIKNGEQYGSLLVLEINSKRDIVRRNRNGRDWLIKCRCVCGVICFKRHAELATGNTKKCNWKCPNKSLQISVLNKILYGCKRGAIDRGHSWNLTNKEAERLMMANCFYCGISPRKRIIKFNGTSVNCFYNGIDRLENTQGYTLINSVPCCKFCNFMKHTNNLKQMLNKVKRIYNYLELQNSYNIIDMARANLTL